MEPDKNKRTSVHCKLCANILKYAGNTTNLRYHLKHSHRAEFQALQLAQASEKEVGQTRTAASSSSIAGYFHGVLIFVIFVTSPGVTKFLPAL